MPFDSRDSTFVRHSPFAQSTLLKLKLTLAYDGSDFGGWQRQSDARTVQAVVEEALEPLAGETVTVVGAGRTDGGVHAAGQVASVALRSSLALHEIHRALNATLPQDVRVLAIDEAPADFDARQHARLKTYRYAIWNGRSAPPLARRVVWEVPAQLDLEAMNDGAALLRGKHDFGAFQSAGGSVYTTTREITVSSWTEIDARIDPLGVLLPADGSRLLRYEVTGTGFLRHMVRTIVGTLVDVGRGRLMADDVRRIMASGNRATAGQTAPPHGLTLWRVDY